MELKIEPGSFRDPCGFLFREEGKLLRQVNQRGKEDYDLFMDSGLYETLRKRRLLIPHMELGGHRGFNKDRYKVIEPENIRFISYPYEWSFSQLKDAALTTLEIQNTALQKGMTLKDASAYNIQFHKGRPVFIDTLSFEKYTEGNPWEAYRQFCQHFLAPLALMSYTDLRLNQMLKTHLDGIPLDLAVRLLPFKTRFKFSLLIHLHLHAKAQEKYKDKGSAAKNITISGKNLTGLIQSLSATVRHLKIKDQETEWANYYTFTNYSSGSFSSKKELLKRFLDELKPLSIWDLAANTGEFTQIAGQAGAACIAFDIDPLAIESYYKRIRKEKMENILPLVMDLTNPSPSIGWNNEERMGFLQRPLPDVILALAFIHHLAISNNLPFNKIARFFSVLSENLVIEFVPKTDSQVQKLLASRKDIFSDYNEDNFQKEFEVFYEILSKEKITDSERTIFLMKRKQRMINFDRISETSLPS
jgi:ribosomal protein L11 methylase PrmA